MYCPEPLGRVAYNDKPKLLAPIPTSILWKFKVLLLLPLWVSSTSPTRKSFKEFYYGLIKHTCEFDYTKPIDKNHSVYYKCKHTGCSIVDV